MKMVYVSQSCLSWEALYHRYGKVKVVTVLEGEDKDWEQSELTQLM